MLVLLNGGLEIGSAALLGGDLLLEGLALGDHAGVDIGSLEGGLERLRGRRDVGGVATFLVGALVGVW